MPNDYETRKLYLDALKRQKTLSAYYNNALVNQSTSNDIGSLAAMDTLFQQQNKTPVQEKDLTPKTEEQQEKSIWEKIGGFFSEISTKVLEGVGGAIEGIVDFVATGVSALGEATGWYETEGINDFIQHNYAKDVAEWGRNTDFFTPWGIANQIDSIADGRWLENWYMPFVDENYTANNYVLGDTTMTDGFGGFMSDAAYSIGFMLPSIVAGIATGGGSVAAQAASLAVMGVGAAGKGGEQALNEGATAGQALGYGVASGAVEVVSEIAVGKVLGLVGAGTGKIAGVIGGKEAGKSVVKELAKTAFEEGMEEVFSDALAPTIEAIYKGNESFSQYSDPNYYKNMARSFASGAFVGGLMGGANTAVSRYRYSANGISFLENQKELYDLADKARVDSQNGMTEAELQEKYGAKMQDLTNKMVESFEKLSKNERAFNNLKNDLQFESAEQLKSQIDKPVMDHIADSVSRIVRSSGIADNFNIKFVPANTLAESDTKAILDKKTNTVVINENYKSEFTNLINHEVLGHLVLDNVELTKNLNDVIEGDKNLVEEYHRYDKQLEKTYGKNKNTLASERLAKFLESHLHDAKAFSKIFSKTSLAKAKTINLLNRFINKIGRVKGISNINKEITNYARQAVAELRKAKVEQTKATIKTLKKEAKQKTTKSKKEPLMPYSKQYASKGLAYAKKLVEDSEGKERTVYKSIISQEGSKYRDAEKVLKKVWQTHGNRFIDLFGGTGTVAMNSGYDNVVLNDANQNLYSIYKELVSDKYKNATEIYNYIQEQIDKWDLRTKEGFENFVDHYNELPKKQRNPLDLLIYSKFVRGGQLYLDEKGNMTSTYLGHPDAFKDKQDAISNIKQTREAMSKMDLANNDFEDILNDAKAGDVVYVDPPYANTNARYNENWTEADDERLMKSLDKASKRGVQFVLSNVLEYRGNVNEQWKKWADKYNVEHFERNYRRGTADEIIVTNDNEDIRYAKDLSNKFEISDLEEFSDVGTISKIEEDIDAISFWLNREMMPENIHKDADKYIAFKLGKNKINSTIQTEDGKIKLIYGGKEYTSQFFENYFDDFNKKSLDELKKKEGYQKKSIGISSSNAITKEEQVLERTKSPISQIRSLQADSITELTKEIKNIYGKDYIVKNNKIYRDLGNGKSKLVAEYEIMKEHTKGGAFDARDFDVKQIGDVKGIDIEKKLNRVRGKIYESREAFYTALDKALNLYAKDTYEVKDGKIYKAGQPIFELQIPKGAWVKGSDHFSVVNATPVETQKEADKRQPKLKLKETEKTKFGDKVADALFELQQQKYADNNNKTIELIKDKLSSMTNKKVSFRKAFDDKTKKATVTFTLDGEDFAKAQIKQGQIIDSGAVAEYNKKVVQERQKIRFEQEQARNKKVDTSKIVAEDEAFKDTTTLRAIENENGDILWRQVIDNYNQVKEAAQDTVVSLSSTDEVIGAVRKWLRTLAPNITFGETRGLDTLKTATIYNLSKSKFNDFVDEIAKSYMDASTVVVEGEDAGKAVKTKMTLREFLQDRGMDDVEVEENVRSSLTDMLNQSAKPTQRALAMKQLLERIDRLNKQIRIDKEVKRTFFKAYKQVELLQKEMKYRGSQIITDIRISDVDFLKKLVNRGWFTPTGNISGSVRKVAMELEKSGYFDKLEKSVVGALLADTSLIDVYRELAKTYDPTRKIQKVLNVDESRAFAVAVQEVRKVYKNYIEGVYQEVEAQAGERAIEMNLVSNVIGGKDGFGKAFLNMAQKVMNPIGVMRTASVCNNALEDLLVNKPIELYSKKRMAQAELTENFQNLIKKSEALKNQYVKTKFNGLTIPRWNLYGLYLNMMAEGNRQNIEQKGYTITTDNRTIKHFNYNEGLMDEIKSILSEQEIADLEAISAFLNGEEEGQLKWYAKENGSKGNPFFQVMEDRYYPITLSETAKGLDAMRENQGANSFFIDASNASQLKERTGARNAVKIVNPYSLIASYIDSMTTVAEINVEMKKIERILNKKIEINGKTMSVIDYISSYTPNFANNYVSYVSKLFGKPVTKSVENAFDKLTGRYATAVLGLNVGSMLTQAASLPTGMNITGVISSLKALGKANTYQFRKNHNWLMKNNGVYRWRVMDHGMIKGLTTSSKFNQYSQRTLNKITEYTLMPMEKLDQLWALMEFGFCQQNIADTMGEGYEVGSEKNMEKASEMFSQVILETMSNSDPIAKSMLRSGELGKFMQYTFGMFASDAQQKATLFVTNLTKNIRSRKIAKATQKMIDSGNYGIYTEEMVKSINKQANETIKQTNKGFAVYGGTLLASGVLAAMAKLLRDWLYGRKDPEDLADNPLDFVKDITMETFIDWVPYIGQLSSYLEYGNQAPMPLSATYGMVDTVKGLYEAIQNGQPLNSTLTNLVIKMSEFFGLPVNNLKNITLGLVKRFNPKAAYEADNFLYARTSGYMSTTFKSELEKGHTQNAQGLLSAYFDAYKVQNTDEATIKEITSIYGNGYENVMPKNYMTSYVDENGNDVQLTSAQQQEFRAYYNTARSDMNGLLQVSDYRNLTDEEKSKIIKKLYNAYYGYAKAKVIGSKGDSKLEKLLVYTNGNLQLAKYLVYLSKISSIKANGTLSKKDLTLNYINKLRGLSTGEKVLLMYLNGYSVKNESRTALENLLRKNGMSSKDIKELLGD